MREKRPQPPARPVRDPLRFADPPPRVREGGPGSRQELGGGDSPVVICLPQAGNNGGVSAPAWVNTHVKHRL
jgi:hypothetical protein